MAYNNFPVSYQPQYYYPQLPQVQQNNNTQSNGIIWVQGEAGAKSYLVAPNNTVQLWDSESQTIYLKSADASGMPSIKTLEYTIKDATKPTESVSYVTKEELSEELKRLREELEEEHEPAVRRNARLSTERYE